MRRILTAATLAAIVAIGASSHPWKNQPTERLSEPGPAELHRFESVEKKLKKLTPGSLLVLDCTKTLVTPKDPLLKSGHWGRSLARVLGRTPQPEETRRLKLLAEMQNEKELVHPRWPSLLSELAESGVQIMVLTKHPTGHQIAGLPSFEDLRCQRLSDLGFKFFKWAPEVDMEKARMLLPGREISMHGGVVFAPDGEKGPVLDALIESMSTLPCAITVVDDSFSQTQSLASSLRQISIPSQVILYRDERAQTPPSLTAEDEERLREFVSTGVWRSEP